jgi:hypothetical protein
MMVNQAKKQELIKRYRKMQEKQVSKAWKKLGIKPPKHDVLLNWSDSPDGVHEGWPYAKCITCQWTTTGKDFDEVIESGEHHGEIYWHNSIRLYERF